MSHSERLGLLRVVTALENADFDSPIVLLDRLEMYRETVDEGIGVLPGELAAARGFGCTLVVLPDRFAAQPAKGAARRLVGDVR